MVEGIEKVSVELELDPLTDTEVLPNTHVPVVDAWLAEPIAGCVAVNAECRLRKTIEVDALQGFGQVVMYVATGLLVGALKECSLNSAQIRGGDAIREARLERSDTGGFPTADDQIGSTVHTTSYLLTMAKRKLIDVAGYESLIYVEIREAVIQFWMVIIHESLETSTGCAHSGGC